MGQLDYAKTWEQAGSEDLPAITDIAIVGTDGNFTVVTSSGAYGFLTTWSWSGTNLQVSDQVAFLEDGAGSSLADLHSVTIDGQDGVIAFGGAADGLGHFGVAANGQIDDQGGMDADLALFETALWISGASGTYLLGAGGDNGGLMLWGYDDGTLVEIGQTIVGLSSDGPDIPDMAHLTQNGRDYVVTLDLTGNSVTLHEVSGKGLDRLDSIGTADGMPANTPTELEIVTLAGEDYVIVAGSGSSSLSVLHVKNGQLTLVDHVIDDLGTRFQGVGVLETIEFEGRVYVAVSGQDSGLTLLTVLPGGQLMTLDTLADEIGEPLDDVTAIEFVEIDGELKILVAGEGWQGMSMIDVDTGMLGAVQVGTGGGNFLVGGTGDDMIDGAGGNDILFGGAGNDILIDGGGADALTGGSGADVFVFKADGATDKILDFELGIDSINLSLMGQAYTVDALDITTIDGGALIDFKGETLEVRTKDGSDLSASDFTHDMLFDISHLPIAPLPPENQTLTGSNSGDLLVGGAGNDDLFGGRGADHLRGEAGNDFLNASFENADFDAASAQIVRLFQATLGREPLLQGHTFWTNRLLDGEITGIEAAAGFMNSKEFQKIYGEATNIEFVTLLFQNVLGRDPAEAGLNSWLANLEGGMDREKVVWSFSESQEFKNAMSDVALGFSAAAYQAEWSDDVYRLFLTTLGREPGVDGLLAWGENLANGMTFQEVISKFVAGPEFQKIYGPTTDTDFVRLLYQNVLGREPAEVGLNGWVSNLENGMTREEVVTRFAQSPEFVLTSSDDLLEFMRTHGQDDTLNGGQGNDVLFGGALADQFVFDTETGGDDQILDFEVWDQVRLINSDYDDSTEILADLTQVGDDVVLDFGDATLLFHDVTLEDFDETSFLL